MSNYAFKLFIFAVAAQIPFALALFGTAAVDYLIVAAAATGFALLGGASCYLDERRVTNKALALKFKHESERNKIIWARERERKRERELALTERAQIL